MENNGQNNARRMTSDRRNATTIQSVEDLSARHGKRLQRWLSTWDAVDHALLVRLSKHIKESDSSNQSIPDTGFIFDTLQNSSEQAASAALERVEHLITICQKACSPNNPNT